MNTHVIVTFSKTYLQITNEEYNQVLSLQDGGSFKNHEGQIIKGSAISELLTIEEFFNKFPDKRPAQYDEFKADREDYQPSSVYARKVVIDGLRQYCREHPEALNVKKLLEAKEKNLNASVVDSIAQSMV